MPPALPSYASGTSDVPLLGDTIGDSLDRTAARTPDGEALVDVATGRRFTYTEFVAGVDALAVGLLRAGVRTGDRVGIWAPNVAEWAFVQYATAKIGAILVKINPAYRTHELEYVLNQSGVALLVHLRQAGRPVDQLDAADRAARQARPLLTGERRAVVILDELVRGEQEAARPRCRVHDRVVWRRLHAVDHRSDERARSEVLTCAGLDVLGTALQQRLVGVALDVGACGRPVVRVDEVDDQLPQRRRVADLVL